MYSMFSYYDVTPKRYRPWERVPAATGEPCRRQIAVRLVVPWTTTTAVAIDTISVETTTHPERHPRTACDTTSNTNQCWHDGPLPIVPHTRHAGSKYHCRRGVLDGASLRKIPPIPGVGVEIEIVGCSLCNKSKDIIESNNRTKTKHRQ